MRTKNWVSAQPSNDFILIVLVFLACQGLGWWLADSSWLFAHFAGGYVITDMAARACRWVAGKLAR